MDDIGVKANFSTVQRRGLYADVCDEATAVHIGDVLLLQHRREAGIVGLHVVEKGRIGINVGLHTLVNLEIAVFHDKILVCLPTFGPLYSMTRIKDLLMLRPVFVSQERDEGERFDFAARLLHGDLACVCALHERAVRVRMPVVRDDNTVELFPQIIDDRDDVGSLVGVGKRTGDEVVLDVDDQQSALGLDLLLSGVVAPQEGPQLVPANRPIPVHVQHVEHNRHVVLGELLTRKGILHQRRELAHLQQAIPVLVVFLENFL
mmetsp:Transcript_32499/g.75114  ORF Transcript_32499/g.75114 Transcript_32499/m.75114 type:complete len:262 (-) Transcript_32499:144-929(-)